jgi:hypothetical protein
MMKTGSPNLEIVIANLGRRSRARNDAAMGPSGDTAQMKPHRLTSSRDSLDVQRQTLHTLFYLMLVISLL